MHEVGVHEAKTTLSALLKLVEAGEEVVIRRGSKPVARIVPIERREPRTLGIDAGRFTVPADFDDPLPDDIVDDFDR